MWWLLARTAGWEVGPTGIKVIPEADVLGAYGTALTQVTARLYDERNGVFIDIPERQITFSLSGPGGLTGPTTVTTTNGQATVTYQSGTSTDPATITAASPGLTDGSASIMWRHCKGLIETASMQIQLMQKSLEQMNLQLHKVLSDITGVTGMKILRAIVAGERNPVVLAQMKHPLVKSSEEIIAKALTGDWRPEHLFTLQQALELYDVYQQKILDCDIEIEAYMKTLESHGDPKSSPPRPTGKRRKNQVHFDLRKQLYRWTGVDITVLPAINAMTAQTVLSESGIDMSRFATEKHYSSWLGLSSNHQITGGKVRKRRTRKVRNRAAAALRVAAQSLHKSKTALGAY